MATREMAVINDSKTNDVYELRDKKLADAQVSTTPSDITVNSVVPVELEDGSCIKIKRDSLVQAFASVLNSNSQSTITTLFGADSNGNHANINMANLASVLSAIMGIAKTQYIPATATTVDTQLIFLPYGIINSVDEVGSIVAYVVASEQGYKTFSVKTDIAVQRNYNGQNYVVLHPTQDEVRLGATYHINISKI